MTTWTPLAPPQVPSQDRLGIIPSRRQPCRSLDKPGGYSDGGTSRPRRVSANAVVDAPVQALCPGFVSVDELQRSLLTSGITGSSE